jgi:RNA polymerase sigma-70 factor, ECF subfamily
MVPTPHTGPDDPVGDDETALIGSLRRREPSAFMTLYDRYHRQVFRYLLHMTASAHEAEELLQAVFVTVWEGIAGGMFERFDAARGTLEGYLLGIARNAARKLLARRARTVPVDGVRELLASESGLAGFETQLEMHRLRKAIAQLPVEFREAIVLCCLQDFSYERAAKVMSCSVGTVGSRVNRGKALLRKALSTPCKLPHAHPVADSR